MADVLCLMSSTNSLFSSFGDPLQLDSGWYIASICEARLTASSIFGPESRSFIHISPSSAILQRIDKLVYPMLRNSLVEESPPKIIGKTGSYQSGNFHALISTSSIRCELFGRNYGVSWKLRPKTSDLENSDPSKIKNKIKSSHAVFTGKSQKGARYFLNSKKELIYPEDSHRLSFRDPKIQRTSDYPNVRFQYTLRVAGQDLAYSFAMKPNVEYPTK